MKINLFLIIAVLCIFSCQKDKTNKQGGDIIKVEMRSTDDSFASNLMYQSPSNSTLEEIRQRLFALPKFINNIESFEENFGEIRWNYSEQAVRAEDYYGISIPTEKNGVITGIFIVFGDHDHMDYFFISRSEVLAAIRTNTIGSNGLLSLSLVKINHYEIYRNGKVFPELNEAAADLNTNTEYTVVPRNGQLGFSHTEYVVDGLYGSAVIAVTYYLQYACSGGGFGDFGEDGDPDDPDGPDGFDLSDQDNGINPFDPGIQDINEIDELPPIELGPLGHYLGIDEECLRLKFTQDAVRYLSDLKNSEFPCSDEESIREKIQEIASSFCVEPENNEVLETNPDNLTFDETLVNEGDLASSMQSFMDGIDRVDLGNLLLSCPLAHCIISKMISNDQGLDSYFCDNLSTLDNSNNFNYKFVVGDYPKIDTYPAVDQNAPGGPETTIYTRIPQELCNASNEGEKLELVTQLLHETIHASFLGAVADHPAYINSPGAAAFFTNSSLWGVIAQDLFPDADVADHHYLMFNYLVETITNELYILNGMQGNSPDDYLYLAYEIINVELLQNILNGTATNAIGEIIPPEPWMIEAQTQIESINLPTLKTNFENVVGSFNLLGCN